MDETVFFNPQNSIGNFHDHNEAIRSAKIYKLNNEEEKLFVVSDANNSYKIFLEDDLIPTPTNLNEQTMVEHSYTVADEF